ncbi:hypothetical protein J3R82DRAFT_6485, partial [Butyriboletus roseoflavus]
MRLTLAFSAASLIAFVVCIPLADMSPNTEQVTLGNADTQCQKFGTICDWPAGTRGPCCAPLLCVPWSAQNTPYLVCA